MVAPATYLDNAELCQQEADSHQFQTILCVPWKDTADTTCLLRKRRMSEMRERARTDWTAEVTSRAICTKTSLVYREASFNKV